jgi:Protein of unknown function (DUF2586)
MALPNVNISIVTGGLNQITVPADGVMGLLLQSAVAPVGVALGVPKQIFALKDAIMLGITAAYDTANTCKVYQHIKEYYDEAKDGAELWFSIVSNALTLTQLCDKTLVHAPTLLNMANGRIKVLGIARTPAAAYVPNTVANGIDIDVITALTNAQTLGADYEAAFKPLRFVLDGYGYAGNTATLKDLATLTTNKAAVLIGGTASNFNSVGLLLGRLAKIPVMRNVGRVRDGAVVALAAYIGTSTLESVETTLAAINDKRYITLRRFPDKAGYYWSDDWTAAAASDDYNELSRGRVMDKAIKIIYAILIEEILGEVEIATNGKIAPEKAKYYERLVYNGIANSMLASGEISDLEVYVDPNQNVLSTGKVCVQVRIKPIGFARFILVELGFKA